MVGDPGGSEVKVSACNAGDPGSIPGSGRSLGEGNGNPLQYSCLENPMEGRSLVGYSPWGHKESDMAERLHFIAELEIKEHDVSCAGRQVVYHQCHLGSPYIFVKPLKSLSCVRLFVTPWTVAHQAPQSMGISRQEYWSGLPFPSPGDLPNRGIEPRSPTLRAATLLSEPPGKPKFFLNLIKILLIIKNKVK